MVQGAPKPSPFTLFCFLKLRCDISCHLGFFCIFLAWRLDDGQATESGPGLPYLKRKELPLDVGDDVCCEYVLLPLVNKKATFGEWLNRI